MLVLKRVLMGLLCASLLGASVASAATTLDKTMQAKQRDSSGYVPRLLAKAGGGLAEVEPNDTPATATAITVGDVIDAAIQTSSDEDWFRVSTPGGGYLRVSTRSILGSLTDTVIEVFDASATNRLAFDDDSGLGLFSSADHVVAPSGGELLVRVRHFDAAAVGAYQLVVEEGTPPPPTPPNDDVNAAEFVECNKQALGTTVGATDDLPSSPCLTIETAGGEVFYRVHLPYSNQLNVQAIPVAGSFDPALVLFTDSADPSGTCLRAADDAFAGEAESVVYTNEDFETGLDIYIAVDSWSPAVMGDFVLDVKCDFVVATETTNWSTLKASW